MCAQTGGALKKLMEAVLLLPRILAFAVVESFWLADQLSTREKSSYHAQCAGRAALQLATLMELVLATGTEIARTVMHPPAFRGTTTKSPQQNASPQLCTRACASKK